MKAAVIEDGAVTNLIVVDALDALPDLTLVDGEGAAIGDLWDGEKFTRPEAPPATVEVPQSIAMWQGRAIMIEDDILDDVLAAVDAIADEKQRKIAQAKLEYSSTIHRDDALVKLIIPQLGKTEAEIDQMFIRGAAL